MRSQSLTWFIKCLTMEAQGPSQSILQNCIRNTTILNILKSFLAQGVFFGSLSEVWLRYQKIGGPIVSLRIAYKLLRTDLFRLQKLTHYSNLVTSFSASSMEENLSALEAQNCPQPTLNELYKAIQVIQQRYPQNLCSIISNLYQRIKQPSLAASFKKDSSLFASVVCSEPSIASQSVLDNFHIKNNEQSKSTMSYHKPSSEKEDSSLPQMSSDSEKPPEEQIQKEVIQKFRPTPTKYEVQEQFLRMKEKKQLNISGQVYNRFGKFQQRSDSRQPIRKINNQNEENLRRVQQWDRNSNKEYRIYTNKVAPRFHSRTQQMAYYQKRQAAKTFSERGYRIDRVKRVYSEKFAPGNVEGRKNKTVSIGFVIDAYRRFQQFLTEDMRKNVRPLTRLQLSYLYAVILTANQTFTPDSYDCFRKFVKIAFDLGSISVYEQDAIQLFLAIHNGLKSKIQLGERIDEQSFCPLPVKNIPRLDFYVPKPSGGYEEEIDVDSESLSLDLDEEQLDEELQFIGNDLNVSSNLLSSAILYLILRNQQFIRTFIKIYSLLAT